MVKSVLSSLPIFFMCCLDILVSIKKQIVKFMRHSFGEKRTMRYSQEGLPLWHGIRFVGQKIKED
jgi:hypothetical protein